MLFIKYQAIYQIAKLKKEERLECKACTPEVEFLSLAWPQAWLVSLASWQSQQYWPVTQTQTFAIVLYID